MFFRRVALDLGGDSPKQNRHLNTTCPHTIKGSNKFYINGLGLFSLSKERDSPVTDDSAGCVIEGDPPHSAGEALCALWKTSMKSGFWRSALLLQCVINADCYSHFSSESMSFSSTIMCESTLVRPQRAQRKTKHTARPILLTLYALLSF